MSQARWLIRASWPELDPDGAERLFLTHVGGFIVPVQFEATVTREDRHGDSTYDHAGSWPAITMLIAMEGARPVVRQLTIGEPPEAPIIVTAEEQARLSPEELNELFDQVENRTPPPRPAITASLLRELPLARLAKYAMLGIAVRFGEGPVAERVVPSDFRDADGFYRIGSGEIDDDDYYGVYFGGIEPAWQELWSEQMEALAAHVDRASTTRRRNRITDELLEGVAQVYRQAIAERRPPKKAVREAWHVSEATAGRYIMRARERGYLGKTVRGKKGEISE